MAAHDEKRRRLDERPGYDSYRPSSRRDSSRDFSQSSYGNDRKFTKETMLGDHHSPSRQNGASAFAKSPPVGPRLRDRLTKTPTLSSPLQRSSCYSPPSPSRAEGVLKSPIEDSADSKRTAGDGSPAVDDGSLPTSLSSFATGGSRESSDFLGKHTIKCSRESEDGESTNKGFPTESDSDPDESHTNDSRRLCKNYTCLGEHNYKECPLPKICWGCRSTNHYWSYCPMTCTKCQSRRHTAKYCGDFEINSTGKSQPRVPPGDLNDKTIGGESLQQKASPSLAQEPEIQQRTSSSVSALKEEPKSSPMMGKAILRNGSADHNVSKPSSQEQAADFLARLDERFKIPKGPSASLDHGTYPPYPPNTGMYDDKGEKIYCNQWLRWGDCSYYHAPAGCRFKHEIPPDDRTQRDIGLRLDSPWLQGAPFSGLAATNGRISGTWSSRLFALEPRSSQEPKTYSAAHDLYRPRESVRSYGSSRASEDRNSGLRHQSRLYSAPVEEPIFKDSHNFVRPGQNCSFEDYHPINKDESMPSTGSTVDDLERHATRAESIARASQAEVVRLAHTNAASYKREEAKKIAKANLADAENARSLAKKAVARGSTDNEDPEKTGSRAIEDHESLRLSQETVKVTTVPQEARRGSNALLNTAYPTPTSQTHEELLPKGTTKPSKPSSILPDPPTSTNSGANSAESPTVEDPFAAMLKAFEDQQAEEEKRHAAAMAAKTAKQKQELETHLKRKADDAKRKREEQERKMDEEHEAILKRLKGN